MAHCYNSHKKGKPIKSAFLNFTLLLLHDMVHPEALNHFMGNLIDRFPSGLDVYSCFGIVLPSLLIQLAELVLLRANGRSTACRAHLTQSSSAGASSQITGISTCASNLRTPGCTKAPPPELSQPGNRATVPSQVMWRELRAQHGEIPARPSRGKNIGDSPALLGFYVDVEIVEGPSQSTAESESDAAFPNP